MLDMKRIKPTNSPAFLMNTDSAFKDGMKHGGNGSSFPRKKPKTKPKNKPFETKKMSSTLNVSDYSVVPWDTVSTAEWVTVGFGSCLSFSILLSCVLILANYNYAPLKAKQWHLVLASGLSSVIFIASQWATSRIFPNAGPFLMYCDLFAIWLNGTLGILLWIDVIVFRVVRLWWLIILARPIDWKFNLVSFFVFATFPIIWAIIGSAIKADGGPDLVVNGIPTCKFNTVMLALEYVYIGIFLILFTYVAWALKDCPKRVFNEYSQNRNFVVLFAVVFIIYLIMEGGLQLQTHVWARVFISFLFLALFGGYFYVTVGPELYHVLVDRADYENKFWSNVSSDAKSAVNSAAKKARKLELSSPETSQALSGQDGTLSPSASELLARSSQEYTLRETANV